MTHHQFGMMVGVGGEDGEPVGEGTFDLMSSVLMQEHSTLAIDTIQQDKAMPAVVLHMSGRVNRTQDTVSVVWLTSVADAGALAGALMHAADRIGTDEAKSDFLVGMNRGSRGLTMDGP